jgi:hypothetical protein
MTDSEAEVATMIKALNGTNGLVIKEDGRPIVVDGPFTLAAINAHLESTMFQMVPVHTGPHAGMEVWLDEEGAYDKGENAQATAVMGSHVHIAGCIHGHALIVKRGTIP